VAGTGGWQQSPRKLDVTGAQSPHFGVEGQVLFQHTEGNKNYLEQVDADGTHRSRVVPFPILEFPSVSPGRRWVIAFLPATPESKIFAVTAIPLAGGVTRRISASYCFPRWSIDGKFLFVRSSRRVITYKHGSQFGDSPGAGGKLAGSSCGRDRSIRRIKCRSRCHIREP
jgi:hypothetical protein